MLLSLLLITTISLAAAILFKRKSVECIAMCIFSITFILYIFGIVNLFNIGLISVFLIFLMSIVYIIYNIIKKKKKLFEFLDVGTLVFIILVLVLYLIIKGSQIICYDEFTAWGMFTKVSSHSNLLHVYSEFLVHAKQYASGTAIFQTFIQLCNFNFSEDLLFTAMHMIYFAIAVNILKDIKIDSIKNFLEVVFRSFIILILPMSIYMWPTFYYTILVDIILGFVFAHILLTYFTNKLNFFTLLNISLACFFITCTKGNRFSIRFNISMYYIF